MDESEYVDLALKAYHDIQSLSRHTAEIGCEALSRVYFEQEEQVRLALRRVVIMAEANGVRCE